MVDPISGRIIDIIVKLIPYAIGAVIALWWCDTYAGLPEWLVFESIAASEAARDEMDIECVQIIRVRPSVGTCITMMEWCKQHRLLGEPVDNIIRCRPPAIVYGAAGVVTWGVWLTR